MASRIDDFLNDKLIMGTVRTKYRDEEREEIIRRFYAENFKVGLMKENRMQAIVQYTEPAVEKNSRICEEDGEQIDITNFI